jgi:hypothetical protein
VGGRRRAQHPEIGIRSGLELKGKLVIGDLTDPAGAALPVTAAMCGGAFRPHCRYRSPPAWVAASHSSCRSAGWPTARARPDEYVKLAVLVSSLSDAPLAAVVLGRRDRGYRQIHLDQERDRDGIPEAFRTGYWVRSWGHTSGGEVP